MAESREPMEGDRRYEGVVKSFDQKRGFGWITRSEDKKEFFLHYSEILGEGYRRIDHGDKVKFSIGLYQGKETAVQVERLDKRPRLFKFAYIPDYDKQILRLKDTAQNENWSYRKEKASQCPVLKNYIFYTFERLEEEEKILYAKDDRGEEVACFNTGLSTDMQEEIFAYLVKRTSRTEVDREQEPWLLEGFYPESDRRFNCFEKKPELANYFTNPYELIYDKNVRLVVDVNHILRENIHRFPEDLRNNLYSLQGALNNAIELAKKRVARNYKTAIPQFYRGSLQLLLPLCLKTPAAADLALVVSKENNVYRASTVLPLDMAYNNARLIARPDREWLNP
jgi:cold shock CspA family protein